MMNYKVKYSIATYSVENQKENIAILGVYDINNTESIEKNGVKLKKNLDKEIIIESSLGGGVGFPFIDKSISIISKNHENKLNEYITNIKEDTIIIFSNKDSYTLIVIYLLSMYTKKFNNKIICMSIGVCKFEGKQANSRFENIWNKVENQANETVLIDCEVNDKVRKLSIKEFELFLFNALLEKVYNLTIK